VPVLCLAALFSALGAQSAHGESARPDALMDQARGALARGDGIDAEVKLRAALNAGVPVTDVNALMGRALMIQHRRDRARPWLQTGRFSPATAAMGWRTLASLERQDGNLAASGRAYDRALAIIPRDAALWVEIGRLRYAGGEHVLAIEAAEHALALNPASVRALEFRGQLVRDRYGLLAALPWFERAIVNDPADVPVLLEYAATLGELGRASECVTVTRRVLQLSPANPKAYYLQAVLAARAGNHALARSLLERTRGKLDALPGVQMVRGVVELAARNPSAAAEAFEAVLRLRPENETARELLVRAILMAGQYRYATLRFAPEIAAGQASPGLLLSVARGWELLGDRQRAGELLDRAARPPEPSLWALGRSRPVGRMLEQGQSEVEAAPVTSAEARRSNLGSYDAQALAGDVQLAMGHPVEAQEHYVLASRIRLSESLFERRLAAFAMARDAKGARELVEGYLRQNPTSRPALRAAAGLALQDGDPVRARTILRWLRDNGQDRDVALLSDLAILEAHGGDSARAVDAARAAYRLQRSSPVATQALAIGYAASGGHLAQERALLEKVRAIKARMPLPPMPRESR
jgi:tetratricopeptide (TPR) repeat protein